MRPIRELMNQRPVVGLPLDSTAFAAAETMTKADVGCVLVLGDKGEAEGIFTERDLMTRVIVRGRDPRKVPLREVMTANVFAVQGDRPIPEVRREMHNRHIRHIPVLEGDRVVAVLSLRDLLRADLAEQNHMVRYMTAYIRGAT